MATHLYPPVLAASNMPAVGDRKGICKIYFTLAEANAMSDINAKGVQMSVTLQGINASALSKEKYPNEIKVTAMAQVAGYSSLYSIDLDASDLEGGAFLLNRMYQVRLRFTPHSLTLPEIITAQWLNEHKTNFSQWSNSCIVQAITKPTLHLSTLESFANEVVVSASVSHTVAARLVYSDPNESDILKNYRIQVFNDQVLIEDSGIQYAAIAAPNEINYSLKKDLENGKAYTVKIDYTTTKLYQDQHIYTLNIELPQKHVNEAIIIEYNGTPIQDRGVIAFELKVNNLPSMGYLNIQRTSYKSNYASWETISRLIVPSGDGLTILWDDPTAESGVWYKYSFMYEAADDSTQVSNTVKTEPMLLDLEDIYLSNANAMLKIMFDADVSSYKHTVGDSVTATLGGKYPYVRRNGHQDYRQFNIGGLISCMANEACLSLSKAEIEDSLATYGGNTSIIYAPNQEAYGCSLLGSDKNALYNGSLEQYQNYNLTNQVSEYADYIYEKLFRDKVIEFLYDNSVKLFRSATEGNILIKLTNIQFTPEKQLGRRVYSFSAQATEVDAATIDKYEEYNIIPYRGLKKYQYEYYLMLNEGGFKDNTAYIDAEYATYTALNEAAATTSTGEVNTILLVPILTEVEE